MGDRVRRKIKRHKDLPAKHRHGQKQRGGRYRWTKDQPGSAFVEKKKRDPILGWLKKRVAFKGGSNLFVLLALDLH